jgi:hypothetical protein
MLIFYANKEIPMKKVSIVLLLSLVSAFPALADGDSPQKSCNNAAKLIADDDLDGALEEAKWCVTLLEQMQQARIGQFFKDAINGYQAGELESTNAMGFSLTKREYTKDDKRISVSLNGMAGGGMDAFAAIAQFGMNASGGKKVRIQKRTAVITADDNDVKVMVTLKKGGTLVFESYDVNADELQAFAEAFPVEALDDSRG